MAFDELPIKITIIPSSAAEVTQAMSGLSKAVTRTMADIEAKVKQSGRRIGQAMFSPPAGATSRAGAFFKNMEKTAKTSNQVIRDDKLRTIKSLETMEKAHIQAHIINNATDKASRIQMEKQKAAEVLVIKKATTAKLRTMQKRVGLEMIRIGKAETAAYAENERRKTKIASIEAKRRQVTFARMARVGRTPTRASVSTAPSGAEAIFQAAGIKSPARRVAEIKNVRRAQAELNKELSRGIITRLQYNTMLKATRNKLNLLERGDVRARGALQRFTAKLASATFEITGAVFGLTALGLALSSPAIAGTKYLAQLEDVKLGISGILLAMGSMNGEMLTFEQASFAADEQIKALANDAISLAGTLEDFTKSFQAILAPGLAAGMTLTEIRKIAVAGTIAVKTIGLDSRQIVQEIRDLVAGGIQAASSTLATSLGLTDRDIKKAKLSSEGLFKFLSAKLDGFYQAGLRRSETLTGKIEQTYEIFIRGLAEASEPVLETLKGLFDDVSSRIATIDKATNKLTFKPKFIDSVKSFIKGIDTALQVLLKVVKVMWEFKGLIGALIGLKIAKSFWGIMTTAALSYAAALRGIMTSEVGLEVIQSARAARSTARAAAATAAQVALDTATAGRGKGFKGYIATADAIGASAAAKKAIPPSFLSDMLGLASKAKAGLLKIGKFGLFGIMAYGVYEIGSKLFSVFTADAAKLASTAGETAQELSSRLAKQAEATATSIGASVQRIKDTIKGLEDQNNPQRNSGALEGLHKTLAALEPRYEAARDKANKFGDAALSVSERITRMGAALTAAKKAIESIGGAYLKGRQDAEKQIQGIVALTNVQETYTKFLAKAEADGTDQGTGFKKRNDEFKQEIELLKEGAKWNKKLFDFQMAANVAVKGSKAAVIAKEHADKVENLANLLGHQKALTDRLKISQEALAKSTDKGEKRAGLEAQIKSFKELLNLGAQRIAQAKEINPEEQAQRKFNATVKQGSIFVKDFTKSLEAKAAAQKAEISSGKLSGFEEAKAELDARVKAIQDQVGQRTDKALAKDFVQGPEAAPERAIILNQERADLDELAAAYLKFLPLLQEFYDTKDINKWTAQIEAANNTTRKYLQTVQDKIDLNKAELSYVGLTGIEISVLKARQAGQLKLNKLKESYTQLAFKENALANGDTLVAQTDEVNAATERWVESLRDRNEEERKWTTGAKSFYRSYIRDVEDSAKVTSELLGTIMSAANSQLSTYFQTGKASFEDFKNAVSKGLADIAAQMLTSGLTQLAVTGLSGLFSGPSSGVAGVTRGSQQDIMLADQNSGFARGAAFDPSGLVAFAKGGIVSTPTTFPFAKGTGLMGEAGPEAIMPLSRTTSGDLGVKVSGGSGGTTNQINVEVNVNSDGSSETTATGEGLDGKAVGNALGAAVQAELIKQMRPGGLLTQR